MPSILNDDDKQNVKRQVPKASNKIHAVAVAKLYIAYPNHNRWQYTGLQGAIVLANDLVGNTFWIKMVDVSVPSMPSLVPGSPANHPLALEPRRRLGPGNLRHVPVQPGPYLLPHLRARGLSGRPVVLR
jgi:hypothetical protein